MNNGNKQVEDKNIVIMKMALRLDEDTLSEESKDGFRKHVSQYLLNDKNNPEKKFNDPIINEAITLYNKGIKTPGVRIIIDAIIEDNEKIYNDGYVDETSGRGVSRIRSNGFYANIPDENDEIDLPNRNGFNQIILIICGAIISGIILAFILIAIVK